MVADSKQAYTAVAGRAAGSRVAGRAVGSRVAGRAVDSWVAGRAVGMLDTVYTLVESRGEEMVQAALAVEWFVFLVYLFQLQWTLGFEFRWLTEVC